MMIVSDHNAQTKITTWRNVISCLRLSTPPFPAVLGHHDISGLPQRWRILATEPSHREGDQNYFNRTSNASLADNNDDTVQIPGIVYSSVIQLHWGYENVITRYCNNISVANAIALSIYVFGQIPAPRHLLMLVSKPQLKARSRAKACTYLLLPFSKEGMP